MEVGTAGGNISKLVAGFPNFHFAEIDGTDPDCQLCCLPEDRGSIGDIRAGKGPAFVHGQCVIRLYSHSLSDDEKLYRPESERQKRRGTRSHHPASSFFLVLRRHSR